jgi:voltage-gated potassium channel
VVAPAPRATAANAHRVVRRQRLQLLRRLAHVLELPMVVLGLAWLALLVVDLTRGLSPGLERAGLVIWGIFVADFALRFVLAPDKLAYLRQEWLTALALLLPALRVFRALRALRAFRAARALRGVRLARLLTSVNRGMRALGKTVRRRGFAYVALLTLAVTFAGAAGMYAFESGEGSGQGFASYGEALWWTAMVMATMGSEFWPRTSEGRLLCLMLALYAFTVFGYVTATLATYFIGRDAEDAAGELASAAELRALRQELASLREALQRDRP